MAQYISVTEALKLVCPFKGDKREVVAFTSNVDTAFEVTDPEQADTLYRFVLTRISGEPRTAITHRNLENWEELRAFLRNTYTEKRTLDYHATQLFGARQGKNDSISEWIQNVQKLSSKFREAALQDCEEDERVGIVALADKLRNICFVQGILSDRIQTIVRSRNGHTFDEIAETALEEESAIYSKNERYRQGAPSTRLICNNCGKTGHIAAKCYLKNKRDAQVNKLGAETQRRTQKFQGTNKGEFRCYNCGEAGHMARQCNKPRQTRRNTTMTEAGSEGRPPDKERTRLGSINTLRRGNGAATQYVRMRADISEGEELLLLVDTGADISILKPDKLDKTKQFDPEGRVKVKGVSGFSIQTLGTVQATIYEGAVKIPFTFQLVGKQVDISCDGIVGRDFLTRAGANISYEKGTLTLGSGSYKIHKVLTSVDAKELPKGNRKLELPGRTEMVVSLPVEGISENDEGITEKRVILEGVYLAGALTKVRAGFALSSIVNTNDNMAMIDTPVLRVTETELGTPVEWAEDVRKREYTARSSEVMKRLRLEHLNKEERRDIERTCLDYQDIFHLPGEMLSSTSVVKHEIRLEPGTEPVNTRPYRLPESQKPEVRRQVEELKRGEL